MANRQNQIRLLLSDDEVNAVADHRWRNRIPSMTEAARQLIAKGLEAEHAEKEGEAA